MGPSVWIPVYEHFVQEERKGLRVPVQVLDDRQAKGQIDLLSGAGGERRCDGRQLREMGCVEKESLRPSHLPDQDRSISTGRDRLQVRFGPTQEVRLMFGSEPGFRPLEELCEDQASVPLPLHLAQLRPHVEDASVHEVERILLQDRLFSLP